MSLLRPAAFAALVVLTGCGSVSLNPMRWFSSGSEERVVIHPNGGFAEDVDFRNLVEQVTFVSAEPSFGGLLIRATGLPPRQGYWDGELVSRSNFVPKDGVLELQFRIREPLDQTDVSVPRAREVEVGLYVNRFKLAGVREIRIVSQSNSRSIRR